MRLVFTSYSGTPKFNQPLVWLKRIEGYVGILERLAKEHEVASIERINYEGEYNYNGVHYYFTRLQKQKIRFPFKMHRLIKQLKPDVVFVNGFIFPLQIIQLRLKLGKGVKIIVLHRAEKPFVGLKRQLQRLADKCVNGYLFVSSGFGDEWIQKGIIRNSNKIAEVIQASSFFQPGDRLVAKSQLSISGNPVFLWVGRLDSNKDPFTVIKAFIRFLQVEPLAKLYMIYQDDELLPQVKFLIENNTNAKKAIQLVGPTPHQQLQAWYNSADYFISGSHYEGSGVAVIEAMSCGCIPILTDIISFRKITANGECGVLYEMGNEEDLLIVLKRISERNPKSEREKVLKQFHSEFSFEAIARKINDVINHSQPDHALDYASI